MARKKRQGIIAAQKKRQRKRIEQLEEATGIKASVPAPAAPKKKAKRPAGAPTKAESAARRARIKEAKRQRDVQAKKREEQRRRKPGKKKPSGTKKETAAERRARLLGRAKEKAKQRTKKEEAEEKERKRRAAGVELFKRKKRK